MPGSKHIPPHSSASGLFEHHWTTPSSKAEVVIAHGLGEHGGRYDELASSLAQKGYGVRAMDHIGHGRSGGRRGHVEDFSDFTSGVAACVRSAGEEGRPVVLLGHSLGGLIAARYAIDHPRTIHALVLSGPCFRIAVPVPAWKKSLAQAVSAGLPWLSLANEIDPNLLSHDEDVVEAYRADPLVHAKISARLFVEMLRTIEETMARARQFDRPLLVMAGGDDQIVDPRGAAEFHRDAGSEDKELHAFDGLYHEIFNETDRDPIHALLAVWIDRVVDHHIPLE